MMKVNAAIFNTDEHFETLKVVNFDIINSNGQIDNKKLREYQT